MKPSATKPESGLCRARDPARDETSLIQPSGFPRGTAVIPSKTSHSLEGNVSPRHTVCCAGFHSVYFCIVSFSWQWFVAKPPRRSFRKRLMLGESCSSVRYITSKRFPTSFNTNHAVYPLLRVPPVTCVVELHELLQARSHLSGGRKRDSQILAKLPRPFEFIDVLSRCWKR